MLTLTPASPPPPAANPDSSLGLTGNLNSGSPVLVPFKTNLRLTEDALKKLEQYIIQRIDEISAEMGRDPSGSVQQKSWMGIRVENKLTYDNDLEWRQALGGIFAVSNFTLGTNRGYARLLAARARADLLGTKPFFGCMSARNGDPELTREVEEYVQDEVDRSNVAFSLREAVKIAIINNDCVVKTTYYTDESPFNGPATVAVQIQQAVGRDGKPAANPDGSPALAPARDQSGNPIPILTPARKMYVYPNDDMIPDPTTQGRLLLKKDPSFGVTVQPTFLPFPNLPQKLTSYDGPFMQVLDPRDFLCPLKVATTWQADINVHLYEEDVEKLKGIYGNIDVSTDYFSMLEDETGMKAPRRIQGERHEEKSTLRRSVFVAEAYVRYDADGDGKAEELMVVMDVRMQKAIFFDYLGNHMKMRPFAVIPGVEKEPNRWYGKGVFSLMYLSGLYIDTQINRINEKASQGSSVTFRHKNAVEEWKSGVATEFGSRKVYDVNEAFDQKNKPPIWRVNLQSDAELDLSLVKEFQQCSANEFGAISAPTASANDLNQSHTATGVMSTERDATVLSQDSEREMSEGIELALWQVTELVLDQMDPTTVQISKDGQRLAMLNKDRIRYLEKEVRLLLTKTRSSEMRATNQQAEAIALRYYQLDPLKQYTLWPLYVAQLKGLEIDNADELLKRPTQQDIQQWQQQQAQQAEQQRQDAMKPPNASVTAKLGDFTPEERPQIVKKFYEVDPSVPAKVQGHQEKNADLQVDTKSREYIAAAKAKAQYAPPKSPSNGSRTPRSK